MTLFDLYKKHADQAIGSIFGDPKKLRHKPTGNIGAFYKEYRPTGKPLTTQIKMDDGSIYFAPSNEFETL